MSSASAAAPLAPPVEEPRDAAAAALGSVLLPRPGEATRPPETLCVGRSGRLVGLDALALGDLARLLGALLGLLLLALGLLLVLLGGLDLGLGLGGLLLGAAGVGRSELAAQLGPAGLGTLEVLVFGHSGGSSPNARR